MIRITLYARFSSENQRGQSITDQQAFERSQSKTGQVPDFIPDLAGRFKAALED
ncbi:MAG: hypothetical protein LV473_22455 [Nitrospira sp.]|nr:hypothetical protein [Nitrospira sp.]